MPVYDHDTLVAVSPFTRQQEGEDIIIGRLDTGVFLAVPSAAVEVLDHLAQGKSVGEVARLSQSEVADLNDFLSDLEANGIVKPIDANGEAYSDIKQPPVKRYHFSNFPQSVAQRIFSYPALIAVFAVVGLALAALLRDPSIWPHGRDLYFTSHRTIIWTILVIVSYGSVVLHESAHLIATRALGINSRLGFGNRLWDFVVEADLSGLWSVPKHQRYLPLLAGSILDALISALLVLLLYAHNHYGIAIEPLKLQVLRAVMFTYMTRIFWQTFMFVRTDYYYVIATMFNCRNLMSDTEDFLRNQLARFVPRVRPVNQAAIPKPERRIISFYSLVWVGGRILAFTFFFSVTIPLGRRYIGNVLHTLAAGFAAQPSEVIDSVLMMFYFILPIAIGLMIWLPNVGRRLRALVR